MNAALASCPCMTKLRAKQLQARILSSFNPPRLAGSGGSEFAGQARTRTRGSMGTETVNVGIVGLGRWAKVLARAAAKSDALKIVAAHSRSDERRQAFEREFGVPSVPALEAMLSNPAVEGVILTVPNEQHLPLAVE